MSISKIKAAVRARDGRCVKCGITSEAHRERYGRALDVHRIVPGSLYTLEGCEALCMECHKSKPKRKRNEPDQASRVIMIPMAEYPDLHEQVCRQAAHYQMSTTMYARMAIALQLRSAGEVGVAAIDPEPTGRPSCPPRVHYVSVCP